MKVLKISKLRGQKLEAQPQPSYTSFPRRCHTIRILFDRSIDVYGRAWKQVSSQSFWNGGKIRRGEHIIGHRLL